MNEATNYICASDGNIYENQCLINCYNLSLKFDCESSCTTLTNQNYRQEHCQLACSSANF